LLWEGFSPLCGCGWFADTGRRSFKREHLKAEAPAQHQRSIDVQLHNHSGLYKPERLRCAIARARCQCNDSKLRLPLWGKRVWV